MRVRRTQTVLLTMAAFAAAVIWTGCDPKLTGTGDGGNNDNGNGETPQVTDAARAVGQVVAFHMDLVASSLARAAEFDSASVPSARSIFPASCIAVTEVDPVGPILEMSVDTCVDGNGTEYRGKAGLEPSDTVDGYVLWPYGDASNKIIATNATNSVYNHSYEQGALTFTFTRGTGGVVNQVGVSSFLRHGIFASMASFQYVDFNYEGSVGSLAEWPSAGAKIQVSWDDVGVFNVEMDGSSHATFSLGGVQYQLDLSSGAVTIPTT